jgi:hypothetical protein
MRNPVLYYLGLILLVSACTAEPAVDLSADPSIPALLQNKLKLQHIKTQQRASATLEHLFIEKAEAQFPLFAQEADFHNLTILHLDCFDIYLSPLDEPGDYLALLHSPGRSARLLFVEWGLQNGQYYQQVLAANGEGIRYFEGMGFEGEENAATYAYVGSLYKCCYGLEAVPLSWLNRFKLDWAELLQNDTKELSVWVKGIPVGGILALYGYAGVYLD